MTFDAVSSSGVRTMAGNSAACVGRVRVMLNAVSGANVMTTQSGAARRHGDGHRPHADDLRDHPDDGNVLWVVEVRRGAEERAEHDARHQLDQDDGGSCRVLPRP